MAHLFFLTARYPYPLDKGDKLRAYHQIRVLSRRHRITLCAISHHDVRDDWLDALRPYCDRIEVLRHSRMASWFRAASAPLSGLPFQVGYFRSRDALRRVPELIEEIRPDHVICQLVRTAEYAFALDCPATIDLMDAFSRGLEQRAAAAGLLSRGLIRLEYRLVREYERRLVDRFDRLSLISERDREAIDHPDRKRIRLVPNGVDLEDYSPREAAPEQELLFVGNMAYPPNVRSTEFLVRRIMPVVWRRNPECRLLIAGVGPPRRIRRLASDRVRVSGWVDDIAECYSRSTIFVAPMVAAIGIQNKILQAMAMAKPCVTTSLANQALGANPDEAVIAETPTEFADAIAGLLADPDRAAEIGRNGRRLIERRFRWEDSVVPLEELVFETADGGP